MLIRLLLGTQLEIDYASKVSLISGQEEPDSRARGL